MRRNWPLAISVWRSHKVKKDILILKDQYNLVSHLYIILLVQKLPLPEIVFLWICFFGGFFIIYGWIQYLNFFKSCVPVLMQPSDPYKCDFQRSENFSQCDMYF